MGPLALARLTEVRAELDAAERVEARAAEGRARRLRARVVESIAGVDRALAAPQGCGRPGCVHHPPGFREDYQK